MALVIIGGIYLASHLPNKVALRPAVALVVAAGLFLLVDIALLSRIQDFA